MNSSLPPNLKTLINGPIPWKIQSTKTHTFKKSTANIILDDKKIDALPLRLGTK